MLTAYETGAPNSSLRLSSSQRRQRVELALEAVGLIDRANHYPRQLSGGQEQRVGIARAIVAHPKLLWRGTSRRGALMPKQATKSRICFKRLNRELNITMLMVTHDRDVASIATKQLLLDRGKFLDRLVEVAP